MSFKCPNCETVIYTRARKHCHVCGAGLPSELLLPEAVIRAKEAALRREMEAQIEADKNLRTQIGGNDWGF